MPKTKKKPVGDFKCRTCDYSFLVNTILQWHYKNSKIHQEIEDARFQMKKKLLPFETDENLAEDKWKKISNKLDSLKMKLHLFNESAIATPEQALQLLGLNTNIINQINTNCAFCNGKFANPQKEYYHKECLEAFSNIPQHETEIHVLKRQIAIFTKKLIKANDIYQIARHKYSQQKGLENAKIRHLQYKAISLIPTELNDCPFLLKKWGKELMRSLNS